MNKIIELDNITKTFDKGAITALDGVSMYVNTGDFVAVMGPSGCGKSTLLNIIASLEKPTAGEVKVGGIDLLRYKKDLSIFRRETIGFIFQQHNLIPTLNILENVQVPMMGSGLKAKQRVSKATMLLEKVGMSHRLKNFPTKLSGGERQRVAIARALANDPKIIIADEPTGSLDSKSSETIMNLLVNLHKEHSTTIVMVTHSHQVAGYATYIINVLDGKIVTDSLI